MGPGTQYLSWITLHDVVRALLHVLAPSFEGVNVVSPNPVRNKSLFSLGRALNLSAVLRFRLRRAPAVGEMADDPLLASQRVIPANFRIRVHI